MSVLGSCCFAILSYSTFHALLECSPFQSDVWYVRVRVNFFSGDLDAVWFLPDIPDRRGKYSFIAFIAAEDLDAVWFLPDIPNRRGKYS